MKSRILLVNPAIYDFAAYDFWLKPYGMLSAAGFLRGKADFLLFDYLDRTHPFMAENPELETDQWERGRFCEQKILSPPCLEDIPRFFRRFGLPREFFIEFLKRNPPADFAFIQTVMTYWYPGVKEVIEDLKEFWPETKIILGGNYVCVCPEHAQSLGPDFLVTETDLNPLWKYLDIEPDLTEPAIWETYAKLNIGAIKLTQGCPFNCTYCSVPKFYKEFVPRSIERSIKEIEMLVSFGVKNVAFYDDALLFKNEMVLIPFLKEIIKRNLKVNLHTPNALNARFISEDLAELLVQGGFKTFYLGFESASMDWQKTTGSKVYSEELAQAVKFLVNAGANPLEICAYQILGHPNSDLQQLEESMYFVNDLGIRGMLADFSPIPGTPDGELCRKLVNLDEPLMHNKTAFPIILLGNDKVNRFKELQRALNRNLKK